MVQLCPGRLVGIHFKLPELRGNLQEQSVLVRKRRGGRCRGSKNRSRVEYGTVRFVFAAPVFPAFFRTFTRFSSPTFLSLSSFYTAEFFRNVSEYGTAGARQRHVYQREHHEHVSATDEGAESLGRGSSGAFVLAVEQRDTTLPRVQVPFRCHGRQTPLPGLRGGFLRAVLGQRKVRASQKLVHARESVQCVLREGDILE